MFRLADGSSVTQISSTSAKWADGFAYGGAFAQGAASVTALTNWDVVRSVGDASLKLNNGNLQINLGTASGNEILLVGENSSTIPQNLTVSMMISQRISGNEVRVGYLQIDPETNLPVPNANLTNFFKNMASFLFTGTTSSAAVAESMEGGQASLKTVSITGLSSTTTLQDFSIECRPEDVSYSAQNADSSNLRLATAPRISSVVPSANYLYRPFIWVRNVAAAASNTVVTVQRVISMDIQEIQAEIGGGRGNAAASQAIPVYQVGSTTVAATIAGANLVAATNGNLTHKLTSAATVNATVVKSTAGRVFAGSITNLGSATRYFKFYNKATALVLATDVPILTIPVPAGQTHSLCSSVVSSVYGLAFATGIAYAITGAPADNDATVIAATEVFVNLVYA